MIVFRSPLSLIFNELVSNTYKHAFKGRTEGEISVALKKGKDGKHLLTVEDNGIGLDPNLDINQSKSLGMTLIKGLSWQIHGQFSYQSKPGETRFEVTF